MGFSGKYFGGVLDSPCKTNRHFFKLFSQLFLNQIDIDLFFRFFYGVTKMPQNTIENGNNFRNKETSGGAKIMS
jgi:hypothetical protein